MLSVAVVGPNKDCTEAVESALDGRDEVSISDEPDARLIIFCGPVSESPYSGCDADVRIFTSDSPQVVRLKALNTVKAYVQGDGADHVETEPGRTYKDAIGGDST